MDEVIKKLNNLAQVDIDAYHAYAQAIEAINDIKIKEKLISFQNDHVKHIDNLANAVKKLGGTPVEFSRDFKGFLITGYTAIRAMMGEIGALKAMETNEGITNRSYDNALEESFPDDIKMMLQTHDEDEKRHQAYIQETLEQLNQ